MYMGDKWEPHPLGMELGARLLDSMTCLTPPRELLLQSVKNSVRSSALGKNVCTECMKFAQGKPALTKGFTIRQNMQKCQKIHFSSVLVGVVEHASQATVLVIVVT